MSRRRFPPPVLLSSFSSFPRKLLKRAIKGNKGRRGENFSSPSQIFCGKRKNRGTTWRMGMASKRNTTCPRGISILREIGQKGVLSCKIMPSYSTVDTSSEKAFYFSRSCINNHVSQSSWHCTVHFLPWPSYEE